MRIGLKRTVKAAERLLFHQQHGIINRTLLLQGVQAARQLRSMRNLTHLSDAGFQVYSQFTEDGIIEWLIQQMPEMPQSFVEFGVEDYTEANTRFLLQHRYWKGIIIDGSSQNIKDINSSALAWRYSIDAKSAFITKDNINDILVNCGAPLKLGILSVDIDGNDYYVWDAINVVDPLIVIAEYNAIFGDKFPISVPYDPSFQRRSAHYSNLYYGCSIAALIHLAESKGYSLLGSNKAGNNAFFVKSEMNSVFDNLIDDRRCFPSMFREARDKSGAITLATRADRLEAISHMPVVNVETGATQSIESLGNLYSKAWLQ